MLSGGTPARGFGAVRTGADIVGLIYDKTDAAVTPVEVPTGFTVAHTSNVITALTFPKTFKFLAACVGRSGNTNPSVDLTDVDLVNGTANLRWAAAPGTCRVYLGFIVGE